MLLFESLFFLPLIASLVAGDIVAAEDNNGTLKTILTRSVDRGQVFAAKALAALTYAAIAVYLATLVATVGGVASWGFNSIKTFSGSTVSASEGLLLVIAANACYLIPLAAVVCIALLLSTATRNSIAGVGGAIGIVILLDILATIPGLEGIKPYLLTEQCENWHGLLRTPTDWAPVTTAGMNGSATKGLPSSKSGEPRTADGSHTGRELPSRIFRNPPIVLSAAIQ